MTLSTIPRTMTVVVPIETVPNEEAFQLNVNVSMTVRVSADTARRKVSQYVMRHVSHLMGGTDPQLVWQNETADWHVPIVLTYPSFGSVGTVGTVVVDGLTGHFSLSDTDILEMQQRASTLAARLPHHSNPTS